MAHKAATKPPAEGAAAPGADAPPDMRAAAVALGKRGFRVFRLNPTTSRPIKKGWTETASSDEAVIYREFSDALGEPVTDNIGILTGGDLLVVDVDVKDGAPGAESLKELKRLGLPENTRTVRTPSGGWHFYCRVDPAFCFRNAVGWRPGVDLRGHHGYVVAPGSTRPNGRAYELILDAPIANLPEIFAAEIREPHRKISDASATVTAEYEDDWSIAAAIVLLEASDATGWEHNTMVALAHAIFDLGVTPATALALFADHWAFELDPGEDLEYQLGNIADGRQRDGKQWGVDHPRRRPSVYLTFERVEIVPKNAPSGWTGGAGPKITRASALARSTALSRSWFVRNLVPDFHVTILSGDGGVGKSLLALQLAVAAAAGRSWLGLECAPGPALYASAEDDIDEVHRRLVDICRAEDIDLAALDDLHVYELAGLDAVMGAPNAGGVIVPTKLWGHFVAAAEEIRPRAIFLDTQADVFGGDEIVRAQARQFIGQLRGLAMRLQCAIILLAHPSLSGMASGAGTSGSTAWSNSSRGRLYLTRPSEKSGRGKKLPNDPNARILSTKKTNYAGGVGDELPLRWEAGRFRVDTPRVKIENADHAAILASALKDQFEPDEAVTVTRAFDALPAKAQEAFGSRPNIANKIRTIIAKAGEHFVKGTARLQVEGGDLVFSQGAGATSPIKVRFAATSFDAASLRGNSE